jgi:chorismate-pyruvate lyase
MCITWFNSPHDLEGIDLNKEFLSWLTFSGSTTRRLKDQYNIDLKVIVLSQGALPLWHPYYNVAPKYSWARTSSLLVMKKPWMLASVVLSPEAILHRDVQKIFALGSKSIGSVIHNDPSLIRTNIKYSVISSKKLPDNIVDCDKSLCVRHSDVVWNKIVFSIVEVFLPHPLFTPGFALKKKL